MSLATALLTPILGDASPWTPRRLFQLGEAGGVYDPSDLTAEKVAWRRNLLTWSEDFTNAAWTKDACTITANTATAPDGTPTADKIVSNNATAQMGVGQSFTAVAREYTASWYVKQAEVQFVQMLWSGGASTNFANVNLATGTVTAGTYTNATVTDAGSGWYRITITSTLSAGSAFAYLWLVNSGAAGRAAAYTGNGTNGVLVWGAQLDLGLTATAYQRITDFTSDFLAAFPTHGLYQDAAGTTPVTALGQPVGLVIDSKTGGLANLGPELLANGIVGLVGTATAATYSTTTGVGTATRVDSSNQSFVQWSSMTGGGYRVTIQCTSGNGVTVRAGTHTGNITLTVNVGQTATLITPSLGSQVTITSFAGTSGFTLSSIREVPGVHAIQPTNSSRPLLDGRVNLLTFSEQFDNAAWNAGGQRTALVTAGATFDLVTEAAAAAGSVIHRIAENVPTTLNAQYVFTARAKPDARRRIFLYHYLRGAWFDLVSGTCGVDTTYPTTVTPTMELQSDGSYLCRMQFTAAFTGSDAAYVIVGADAQTTITATRVGDGVSGVYLDKTDLRLAADAAYPYQRVAAATDYADVGVPRSFAFDGFDDSLYTASNMDLSGTDKVTVLAGVRKLSDAATGIAVELTSSSNVNTGSFALLAPSAGGANSYRFLSHGTGISTAGSGVFAAAPDISVLTGIADIAGDVCSLRRNGAVVVTSATDQGTGNYSSAVLFIGRRNNTSDPLTGKAYQLIVRGALTDAATLAQAERYVGAKTGLYI